MLIKIAYSTVWVRVKKQRNHGLYPTTRQTTSSRQTSNHDYFAKIIPCYNNFPYFALN